MKNIKKYRVIILVILILAILQFAAPILLYSIYRYSPFDPYLENSFRFGEKVDKVLLDGFIYHIKKTPGYRIVFIGDSVVAGATVRDNKNTIPAAFQSLVNESFPIKKVTVFNLGMPGNRASDVYYTLEKLQQEKAADFVIMNINYAFYSPEMLNEKPIGRAELYKELITGEEAKRLGLKPADVESFANNNIAQLWSFYKLREEFSFYLFGMNLREKLTKLKLGNMSLKKINPALTLSVNPANNLDKSWQQNKPFTKEKITHWEQVFNISKLDTSNSGYWYFKKTTSFVRNNKIKLFAFFTPTNQEMIKEYDLMKYGKNYDENISIMKNALTASGIPFVDLIKAISSNDFNDLFHMGAEGNIRTASFIMKEAEALLKRELAGSEVYDQ